MTESTGLEDNNQLALQNLAGQLAAGGNHVTINLVQNQTQVQGAINNINTAQAMNSNSNANEKETLVTKDYFNNALGDLKGKLKQNCLTAQTSARNLESKVEGQGNSQVYCQPQNQD